MFNENKMNSSKDKTLILSIVNSQCFKDLFINRGITNVIIFGSLANGDFTPESDVDIAIISKTPISFNDELILTQKLEELLDRDIDLIDINDENINNLIKISALNSKFVVLKDYLLDETIIFYDNLYKDNEEFWRILDQEVLGIE
ncbi:nucleotidyltransferase family protein [Clostridium saccharobutylicum]|uniref:Nucleotidyltransferase n=1 Tax=Clostridium saccharobutylicum DSM 13864 TaxID=1345695 RepID=U5MLB8_CLOSA|nr:nucleotidyltransferase domain-containing protein [Clostridium saccharobutylicum]AGX41599.1 nucleotidyltransferase [Clostridium saccharobutylicum DSM 13864]AQR88880.1 nucleotidyltransferase domain protein [Clostridium saccharobutylicum]AQR98779.1 nucleotidyltransferase domain protein [Clostridium saccharobutylicum]AQS08504.1 nucleotidyltransferase domain protein [Clostridium saccharobutylicum]AQS12769.1 nucleotidyltransferase domain protein [Clostridium saccharobutylicum]